MSRKEVPIKLSRKWDPERGQFYYYVYFNGTCQKITSSEEDANALWRLLETGYNPEEEEVLCENIAFVKVMPQPEDYEQEVPEIDPADDLPGCTDDGAIHPKSPKDLGDQADEMYEKKVNNL